ncbi:MAG: beta-ketoacyl-ACP synthase II [Nanoarchaeota archaeon]|nr:beta-ketoacyl-ACP synthase II [Nanoarchaeota archaeon]
MEQEEQKRVVVTGLGVISPLGNDINTFWGNLIKGVSGIDRITRFDTSNFEVKIAAEVKNFDPEQYNISRKEARNLDLFSQYALAATEYASNNLEIPPGGGSGAIIGTGIGGLETTTKQQNILKEKGPNRVSPKAIPTLMPNAAPGDIAIKYSLKGPDFSVSSACASGAHAISLAYKEIKCGETNLMVTGGTEAPIVELAIATFTNMRAITKRYNDYPKKASRPFDAKRDGFVLGEGAGILILEEEQHALERNAKIYAELIGCSYNGDAYHLTAPNPSGEGAANAMLEALSKANLNPEQIDYINAHGTSTPLNDKIETLAIKKVFGEYAKKIPVSSTKSMTGHLLGAAGSLEAIISVLSINNNIIPPTINYEHPDPECDLDYVPNKAREKEVNVVMSNSFGFGGHNAVLVFRRYK